MAYRFFSSWNKILIVSSLSLPLAHNSAGQVEVPIPLYYYSLDEDNYDGGQSSYLPVITPPGQIYSLASKMLSTGQNRFNVSDKCVYFDNGSSNIDDRQMHFATLINDVPVRGRWGLPNDASLTAFTMACWINFEGPQDDGTPKLIFGASEYTPINPEEGQPELIGAPKFGLFHKGQTLTLRRYVDDNNTAPYDYPIWRPAELSSEAGWYFIALTQDDFTTRVFVGKPNGEFECSYRLYGKQPLDQLGYFFTGKGVEDPTVSSSENPVETFSAVDGLDDLALWTTRLSPEQVYSLFNCSKDKDPNEENTRCWGEQQGGATTRIHDHEQQETVVQDEIIFKNEALIFPNPSTSGQATIRLQVSEETPVELLIHDLSGRIVAHKYVDQIPAGAFDFRIDQLLPGCGCLPNSGIYLIKIRTNLLNTVERLIIRN